MFRTTRIGVLLAGALLCADVNAQWLNYPAPGTPRTKDGKPDLAARPPRANGKPDLSGVWRTRLAPPGENERIFGVAAIAPIKNAAVPGDDPTTFSKYYLNILADFKPEEAPIRPEAAELTRKHQASAKESPSSNCLPQGITRADIFAYAPFKIVQTPGLIVMMYEADGMHRQIYTDGRKLPVDPQPAWLGYSTGRWEGDTLVIDTAGFNDKTWLDGAGHPHSEDLRVQERFHRRAFGQMDLEMTIDDPKMYTRPITIRETELLIPDSDILEYVCNENERDLTHLPGH